MTPEKAIEILQLHKNGEYEGDAADLEWAQQMSIEALERIQNMRQYKTLIGLAISNPGRLLPSEAMSQESQKRLEAQAK